MTNAKTLVRERAIYQRIRDYLSKYQPDKQVRKAGPAFVFTQGNTVLGTYEKVDALARELAVMRHGGALHQRA